MLPRCFFLQADVFPRAKAEAARRLHRQGWSQVRIAKALQISQTMVSRHSRQPTEQDPIVARLAEDVVRHMQGEESDASWCDILAEYEEPGKREVLTDLLEAEHILRDGNPLGLMPQIGINLAVSLPDAVSPDQVAGFPGRIIEADGRLLAPVPPNLGGSGHLARCILHIQARYPEVRAMANVRGSRAASNAARSTGTVWSLDGGDEDREVQVERKVPATRKRPDFIEDPGGFGIEPCLYVCGDNGRDVALRILALHAAIHPE